MDISVEKIADKSKNFNSEEIGRRLKQALKSAEKTPAWLAEQTGIGVRTLYSLLNGHHLASPDKLVSICNVLSLSMDTLFDMELNVFPLFEDAYPVGRTLPEFERIWFGPRGGERISVSRIFSIAHQKRELRQQLLSRLYGLTDEDTQSALGAFDERRKVIEELEKSRLEVVPATEIKDFILQNQPYNLIDTHLVHDCVEHVIDRLKNDPLRLEVVLVPWQSFPINYEIINREILLINMGNTFLRQSHPDIIAYFLKEVEQYKIQRAMINERASVIKFLEENLAEAKAK